MPLDLAVDVWCQLSPYAKERLQEVFCPHDHDFEDFLEVVIDAAEGHSHRFMEESAMLDRKDLNPKERLYLIEKQIGPYDIELCNPPRTRKYQNVFYDAAKCEYYAVSAVEDDGKREYFGEEDLISLILIEQGRK